MDFPRETAFLFLEFESLGVFKPLGICSETEEPSLELANLAKSCSDALPNLASDPFAGPISTWVCVGFLLWIGDPSALSKELLETLDNFSLHAIDALLDLYGNWLILPLKLLLPKQENFAALSANPGSVETKLGFMPIEFPKLGSIFSFPKWSTRYCADLEGELVVLLLPTYGAGENSPELAVVLSFPISSRITKLSWEIVELEAAGDETSELRAESKLEYCWSVDLLLSQLGLNKNSDD